MNLLLGLVLLACLLFPAGAAAPRTAAETGGSSKSRKAPLSKQNFVAVRGGQAATLTIVKIVRNLSAKSSTILLVLTYVTA